MSKHLRGFTLIELIVVIVILGILAATALPRFITLSSDAKQASMKGLAGGLRSAVEIVRAKWYVAGSTGATTATMADGTLVTVGTTGTAAGVPVGTSAGIGAAIGSTAGYAVTYAATTNFSPSVGPTGCVVTYVAATGIVDEVAVTAANCP